MRRACGALSAVVLVALTACGGSNPADSYKKTDPKTILSDAHTALDALSSVHVTGSVMWGNEPVTLDLTSDKSGNLTGSVTFNGLPADVIVSAGHSYLRPSDALAAKFFSVPAQVAAAKGKWIIDLPAVLEGLSSDSLKTMIEAAAKDNLAAGNPTVTGTSSVNGVATVQVTVSDAATQSSEVLDVQAAAPHNVLKQEDDALKATLMFDRFNAPVSVAVPAAADIVTLAQITSHK